jgi:hypothetical protein
MSKQRDTQHRRRLFDAVWTAPPSLATSTSNKTKTSLTRATTLVDVVQRCFQQVKRETMNLPQNTVACDMRSRCGAGMKGMGIDYLARPRGELEENATGAPSLRKLPNLLERGLSDLVKDDCFARELHKVDAHNKDIPRAHRIRSRPILFDSAHGRGD